MLAKVFLTLLTMLPMVQVKTIAAVGECLNAVIVGGMGIKYTGNIKNACANVGKNKTSVKIDQVGRLIWIMN